LLNKNWLAERKGFEPLRRFPAYTLSRRAPSTTRPSLRILLLAGNRRTWEHSALQMKGPNGYSPFGCAFDPSNVSWQCPLNQKSRGSPGRKRAHYTDGGALCKRSISMRSQACHVQRPGHQRPHLCKHRAACHKGPRLAPNAWLAESGIGKVDTTFAVRSRDIDRLEPDSDRKGADQTETLACGSSCALLVPGCWGWR
jgi:hypothetical protein